MGTIILSVRLIITCKLQVASCKLIDLSHMYGVSSAFARMHVGIIYDMSFRQWGSDIDWRRHPGPILQQYVLWITNTTCKLFSKCSYLRSKQLCWRNNMRIHWVDQCHVVLFGGLDTSSGSILLYCTLIFACMSHSFNHISCISYSGWNGAAWHRDWRVIKHMLWLLYISLLALKQQNPCPRSF